MNTRNAGKRGLKVSRSGTSHHPRCQGADSLTAQASRDLNGCQKTDFLFGSPDRPPDSLGGLSRSISVRIDTRRRQVTVEHRSSSHQKARTLTRSSARVTVRALRREKHRLHTTNTSRCSVSLKEFDFKLRGMSVARRTTCGPAHERVGKAEGSVGDPSAGSQEEIPLSRTTPDQGSTWHPI
jgi:hypothetical protein